MRVALALAILLAGCVDLNGPRAAITGAWSLSSANGSPPPVTLFQYGSDSAQLVRMTITFDRDGTYSETGVVRSVTGGATSSTTGTDRGVWTVDGGSVTLRSLEGGISTLDIQPDLLSFVDSSTRITMNFSREKAR